MMKLCQAPKKWQFLSKLNVIQITEHTCFITAASNKAKVQLIMDSINDKILPNVTIKDELSDYFFCLNT